VIEVDFEQNHIFYSLTKLNYLSSIVLTICNTSVWEVKASIKYQLNVEQLTLRGF